ncbi:hypothetical protein [Sphingomonas bacterium]|uniref:hypothetical protein n=1 Tax=Sphingomonas bacterium TaxID=1895847 RepID=UPI0026345599|nr:hypothetical protein [Sphingomonas bacterium]MDB5677056.1 hypothetical protein [Sphingomonas bacterium]
MDNRLVIAALSSALVTCPVLAQDGPAAAPKPVREKKICRSEISTGSILRATTCHTKAEWAAIDARNQRDANDAMSNRGAGRPSSPSGL